MIRKEIWATTVYLCGVSDRHRVMEDILPHIHKSLLNDDTIQGYKLARELLSTFMFYRDNKNRVRILRLITNKNIKYLNSIFGEYIVSHVFMNMPEISVEPERLNVLLKYINAQALDVKDKLETVYGPLSEEELRVLDLFIFRTFDDKTIKLFNTNVDWDEGKQRYPYSCYCQVIAERIKSGAKGVEFTFKDESNLLVFCEYYEKSVKFIQGREQSNIENSELPELRRMLKDSETIIAVDVESLNPLEIYTVLSIIDTYSISNEIIVYTNNKQLFNWENIVFKNIVVKEKRRDVDNLSHQVKNFNDLSLIIDLGIKINQSIGKQLLVLSGDSDMINLEMLRTQYNASIYYIFKDRELNNKAITYLEGRGLGNNILCISELLNKRIISDYILDIKAKA